MKFRKKPVVIEAVQWQPELKPTAFPDWLWATIMRNPELFNEKTGDLQIRTLEGVMRVSVGDWIIRGVKGELYPCKPDIFAATYDSQLATEYPECNHVAAWLKQAEEGR